MNRKQFLRSSCYACLGIAVAGMSLSACSGPKYLQADLSDRGLLIPKTAFEDPKIQHLIVSNSNLQYPVALFKSDHSFRAYLMKCTHQGMELNLYGEEFSCPAHGSTFNRQGDVTNGPATENLRSFPVEIHEDHLLIILQ